jgi:protein tyrosine/serine phosphatase
MLQLDRDTPAALRHLIYALHDGTGIVRAVAKAPLSRSSWGRLLNLPRFGEVVPQRVYRSGSPRTAAHVRHVLDLGIKTILCVRRTGPNRALRDLAARHRIELRVYDLVPNGHHDPATALRTARDALDPRSHPALVCCDGGRHHAGLVVALLRLELGHSLEDTLSEYYSFAAPSPFADNVLFIVRAAAARDACGGGD